MRRCHAATLATLITLAAQGAQAQDIPADPLLEARRIEALEARTNALGSFTQQGGVPDPGAPQARSGPCFDVQSVTVTGVTALSQDRIDALMAGYVPACLQGADIQAMMRDIDRAYGEEGLITTKTYIPPQNLAEGTLTLDVLEGRIEGLFLVGPEGEITGARAKRLLGTAFPEAAPGDLFDLRGFEQGLDQMNRLTSVDAKLQLQPGDTPGGSFVIVERAQADRFRGRAQFDTLGSDVNGRLRVTLGVELDDALGLNDAWAASLSGTANSNAISLSGSVPYGRWTFGLDLSASEYLTPLSPVSELFGTASTAELSAGYMLHRDQFSTTSARARLAVRDSERFVNNAQLIPLRLSTLQLGLERLQLSETARNSFDGTLTLGLPWFDATRDPDAPLPDEPRAQFLSLGFGWQRQGALGSAGTLVTDLRGQFSPVPLYGVEQLALGSYSTIRGYDAPVAIGDSGIYLRSDLYLSPELWTRALPVFERSEILARIQPHVFADFGVTHDRAGDRTQRAAGIGAGLSWDFWRFNATALVALPLVDDRNRWDRGAPLVQVRLDTKLW